MLEKTPNPKPDYYSQYQRAPKALKKSLKVEIIRNRRVSKVRYMKGAKKYLLLREYSALGLPENTARSAVLSQCGNSGRA